ncbi:MAG: 50S ribosomal protein L17 [Bacteroidota bacterium]
MRHGKKLNHLGRKSAHRKALMKNMAIALIDNKRITTTLAKAKALRRYIEPLVTKTKTNTTHSRRVVFSYLQNKVAVSELFGTIAEKVANRPGGYVRIIKMGFRKSDGAEMAMIEFVDFNEVYTVRKSEGGKETAAKKKRTRRGRRKATDQAAATTEETSELQEDQNAENDSSEEE